MLTQALKDKLKANWALAESMACKAEVRVFDPLSSWQCYILAMDPENENTVACIISSKIMNPAEFILCCPLCGITSLYNEAGESMEIDQEYRPRMASQIFKQLNEGI